MAGRPGHAPRQSAADDAHDLVGGETPSTVAIRAWGVLVAGAVLDTGRGIWYVP